VAALVVTNSLGDVLDVRTGRILAGARDLERGGFVDTAAYMRENGLPRGLPIHTTIGVVVTDAALTKAQATRLALLAHTGLARTVSPSHTALDGDTFFVLSKGHVPADWVALQAATPHAVAEAVMRSVRFARSLGGVPGLAA